MNVKELFLEQHARVHSRAVARSIGPSLCDAATGGLTREQLLVRPPGLNSIAWLIWHMARNEDVYINVIVRNVPQVLDRGPWLDRLRVDARHIGVESTPQELDRFHERVALDALREYRDEVGIETNAWVQHARFADLDYAVTAEAARVSAALDETSVGGRPRAEALWRDMPLGWFASFGAIEHPHHHLGEAMVTRNRILAS
jgi:hypothetical protein